MIKRKAEDNWLQFDTFIKQLEAEINNLRTFKGRGDTPLSSLYVSTVSTLMVQNKKNIRFLPQLARCAKHLIFGLMHKV